MIELVPDLPEYVIGFLAKGHVTAEDYDNVLVPTVKAALAKRDTIRCYYELGREFNGMDAGAAWRDFTVGVGHLFSWERVAVVTDVPWIVHAINALRFLMPGEIRVFATAQAHEARSWISAP